MKMANCWCRNAGLLISSVALARVDVGISIGLPGVVYQPGPPWRPPLSMWRRHRRLLPPGARVWRPGESTRSVYYVAARTARQSARVIGRAPVIIERPRQQGPRRLASLSKGHSDQWPFPLGHCPVIRMTIEPQGPVPAFRHHGGFWDTCAGPCLPNAGDSGKINPICGAHWFRNHYADAWANSAHR